MTTTNTQLQKKVDKQNETIATLLSRVSALTDNLATLQNDLNRFKKDVANDVRYLTERVDE